LVAGTRAFDLTDSEHEPGSRRIAAVNPAPSELEALAAALRALPEMDGAQERDTHRYPDLPTCVLAAVFSINARYSVVKSTIARYRAYYGLMSNGSRTTGPEPTVSEFIERIDAVGPAAFASDVLKNRMRTSSRSGILKTEAVRDYAAVLLAHGIELMADVSAYAEVDRLERDLRAVHGQSSGISTHYFFMNTGDTSRVKPDRWVIAFLERSLGRNVSQADAQALFVAVCPLLDNEYPGITPRALDLAVWEALSAARPARSAPDPESRRRRLERQIATTETRLTALRAALAKLESR
jgi:hypothetical protein